MVTPQQEGSLFDSQPGQVPFCSVCMRAELSTNILSFSNRLIGHSELPVCMSVCVCVKGCLSLHVSPVTSWGHVLGEPVIITNDAPAPLWLPKKETTMKAMNEWRQISYILYGKDWFWIVLQTRVKLQSSQLWHKSPNTEINSLHMHETSLYISRTQYISNTFFYPLLVDMSEIRWKAVSDTK